MAPVAQQIAEMVDMLPEHDQELAFELIKKLVLAWDPDYTKLTPSELETLKLAEQEFANGEVFSSEDIDWN
ncbi:hypothetical protein CLOSTMETH_00283 [[Clostridium] methylpentosum DSM 5476]|uniref:Uncharacterized protein n=1 Tax=[Clostridium] methylpentosum DSM 5476 TaxID=537013 RepID=C0E8Y8_9FIRM|nr:hypothetical protein CLOSTMETH_00283 [[Clostridium] methylpentosum DSM 5476]MDY3988768.1 hypothetical protein [Massilioclostridium sp.]MEE1492868.1 hypothetical protein [Massilioclostridium sp.]